MLESSRQLRRNILHERASARHVQHLDASTDRKDRQIGLEGQTNQLDFVLVASGFGRVESRVRRLAVDRRVDVAATSQQKPGRTADDVRGSIRGAVEDPRVAAGALESPSRNQAACRTERWQSGALVYILGGTSIPMRSNARVSWPRT